MKIEKIVILQLLIFCFMNITLLSSDDYSFTGSSIKKMEISQVDLINSSSKTLFDTINIINNFNAAANNTYLLTPEQKRQACYAWSKLRATIGFVELSVDDQAIIDKYKFWFDALIVKDFITDSTQSSETLLTVQHDMKTVPVSKDLTYDALSKSIEDTTAQTLKVEDNIAQVKTEKLAQDTALENARKDAYKTFTSINKFMKGRLGVIKNSSNVSYQLIASDGTILDTIKAGQTSSNSYDLGDTENYSDSNLGSMFRLVPYDAQKIEEDGTSRAIVNGGTIVILCNMSGVNQPGNPYGYPQTVSITRVYPSVYTRMQSIDIATMVTDNQYWQINFEINPISPVADASKAEVIFPRISSIQTVSIELNDPPQDLPKISDVVMDTTIKITRKNSVGYPDFTVDDDWTDLPA